MILDYHSDPFILSHVFDFTELLLAYACPSGILQRKIDARPINANDGSKMAGCNKSKTHVIRRPKRIFCLDAFNPPGSGPQQRKTCCKANTHFKNIWWNIIVTIKMYIPVCATSNLFKLVPTWTTTKKKPCAPASTTSYCIQKIRSSRPRLFKWVPDFTGAQIQPSCRFHIFHILQRHLPPPAPDHSGAKHVAKPTCTWSKLDQQKPYVPASTTSQYIPKTKTFQWAKANQTGSWFYRFCNSCVVQVPHFTEAPSPSQLQTPAAQNMLQSKHAPELNLKNNKKSARQR